MRERLLAAALYPPWCACTAGWAMTVCLLAPFGDWTTDRRTRP